MIEAHDPVGPQGSAGPHDLPDGLTLVRTTPEFTDANVPAGLLSAHRVAAGTWGRLRVIEGAVRFVFEDVGNGEGATHDVSAGGSLVIPPRTPHRVEPGRGSRFVVEFHTAVGA